MILPIALGRGSHWKVKGRGRRRGMPIIEEEDWRGGKEESKSMRMRDLQQARGHGGGGENTKPQGAATNPSRAPAPN